MQRAVRAEGRQGSVGSGSENEVIDNAMPDRAPLVYVIDVARQVLVISLLDVSDADSSIRALEWIRADPAFDPSFSAYVDLGHLSHPFGADYLRAVAQWACGARSDFIGRGAIVARGSRAFDAARTFVVLASLRSNRVRVFRSRTEALAWLEVVPALALVRPDRQAPDNGQPDGVTSSTPFHRRLDPGSLTGLVEAECVGGRCHGERRRVSSTAGARYMITTEDGRAGWYVVYRAENGVPRLVPAENEPTDRRRRVSFPRT